MKTILLSIVLIISLTGCILDSDLSPYEPPMVSQGIGIAVFLQDSPDADYTEWINRHEEIEVIDIELVSNPKNHFDKVIVKYRIKE